jgi:transposase
MDTHVPITLTDDQRDELRRHTRSRRGRAEDVRRARVILMLAAGEPYSAIQAAVGCFPAYISRWKERFVRDGLAGLGSRYRGQPRRILTPQLEARILDYTRRPPPDGSTHWSTRKLAKVLGVSHMMVARVWARAGLQPHRFRRYMASTDPDFETKAADVIGLYLNPPRHAAVFAFDEKSAIQALDRLQPVLPLSPGRAERHGFEYYRHGTVSLLAALDTQTGKVIGRTVPHHTSAAFVDFLADVVAAQPRRKEIHIILDNLSTHKTKAITQFLVAHPSVYLHFTPTYASWLNQIELWFSKMERDLIARGIFRSVGDLRRKIMRYIRHCNRTAQPIRWVYFQPDHRITLTTTSDVTGH